MSTWANRRKTLYAAIVVVILAAALGLPSFFFFYKAPSCFDGIQNGNEQGIDCGGSCTKLCQSAFLAPAVSWTRFKSVAPGLYNVAAYIVNPNQNAEATGTPYHMALYDAKGMLITDVYGQVTLPPRRDSLAFQGAVAVGSRLPARAFFEFTAAPNWFIASDPLSAISIGRRDYQENQNSSSLLVTLNNASAVSVGPVTVYVVLFDQNGDTLDFSKTIVDQVPANGSADAPFTWPESHHGAVVSIAVLPVAE